VIINYLFFLEKNILNNSAKSPDSLWDYFQKINLSNGTMKLSLISENSRSSERIIPLNSKGFFSVYLEII
jgi:hypothetical protein